MKQLTLFSLLFAGVVQTFAQQAAVTGPDSRLKLDFQLQDGKPVYSVTYDGKPSWRILLSALYPILATSAVR